MGKIAKGVNKMHFTMLYGNYCYIFIENIPKKFSPCSNENKNLVGTAFQHYKIVIRIIYIL